VKRTVMIVSVAVLVLVVALSAFLGTRHPVGDATSAPSPLLGKMAPALAGPELGAVAIVAALSLASGKPFVIVRKGEKGYGTNKAMEGKVAAGQRVVMVEDVVTSGGAALMAVDKLRDAGLQVSALLCVVDREEGGCEAITAADLVFDPLFTVTSLGIKGNK